MFQAKAKNCSVLGFVWLSNSELVFITDLGLELYTVNQEKRSVKYVRSVSDTINWFSCHVSSHVLVTSASGATESLQVWSVRGGNISKLSTLSLSSAGAEVRVRSEDVRLVTVYDDQYLAVVTRPELRLFRVGSESVVLTHVLTDLDTQGSLGLHTIDNLILVHSQSQSRTKIYDIQLTNQSRDEAVSSTNQDSVLRVAPCLPASVITGHETYSPHWVVFLPNTLVDAKNGKMWSVNMKMISNNLPSISSNVSESVIINQVRFLINREHGKSPLINLLKTCVTSRVSLVTIKKIFEIIVSAYTCHQQHVSEHVSGVTCTSVRRVRVVAGDPPAVILDQPDVFTNVFNNCPGEDYESVDCRSSYIRAITHTLSVRSFMTVSYL